LTGISEIGLGNIPIIGTRLPESADKLFAMNKQYFQVIVCITMFYPFISMFGQITFQRTYGGIDHDVGLSVEQTIDGGYILLGQTSSFGNGNQDMYLIKTDQHGMVQWSQTYGGSAWEFGVSVAQTKDGGFILCGSYGGIGNDVMNLIRTDVNGNEIWNRTYSGSVHRDTGQHVKQTSDGGFIAVGTTGAGFDEDIYVVKVDSNGLEQWSQVYSETGRQLATEIHLTSTGYAIVGESNHQSSAGLSDILLLQINNSGLLMSRHLYGTTEDERGKSMHVTSDGGFILLGYEHHNSGDIYLIRTDMNGNELWHRYFGDTGWDIGYSVQQTSDGGYIIAGQFENTASTNSEMYCIKTDSQGTILWERTYPYGIYSGANSIDQTADGGYALLGSTFDTTPAGTFTDFFFVKTDHQGTLSIPQHQIGNFNHTASPNPFNQSTIIRFDNPNNLSLTLRIMNSLGQEVKVIPQLIANQVEVTRDGLANGVYFYRLISNGSTLAQGKLVAK
jgi:hypothetical protein